MAETSKRMRREVWALDRIRPYDRNPKTHPPAQVALLAELLKQYGPDQDIVVDELGVIIKGHGRRAAAATAGMTEFPVTIREGLTEAEKQAMRIADNQLPLLGGWDKELLRGEIARLQAADYQLNLLGFGEVQLVQFTTLPKPPDQFPEVGDDLATEHQCPRCKYRWSGSSAPQAAPPPSSPKPKAKR